MKRILCTLALTLLASPAVASEVGRGIAEIQIPKIHAHLDAAKGFVAKRMIAPACSEFSSAEMLISINYTELVKIDSKWAELYDAVWDAAKHS